MSLPKEMQMCLPDWLETYPDRLTGLRAVIYKRTVAKRKHLRELARERRAQEKLRQLLLKGAKE